MIYPHHCWRWLVVSLQSNTHYITDNTIPTAFAPPFFTWNMWIYDVAALELSESLDWWQNIISNWLRCLSVDLIKHLIISASQQCNSHQHPASSSRWKDAKWGQNLSKSLLNVFLFNHVFLSCHLFLFLSSLESICHLCTVTGKSNLAPILGQIGPKLDKSGAFSDQIPKCT